MKASDWQLTVRLSTATAVGVFADMFAMGDAFSYASRMSANHRTAMICALVVLLLVPAILNLGAGRTIAIAAMVWAGMTIAHTLVLVMETVHYPTSHNLWPFEYVFLSLIALVGLAGSALGRAATALSRLNQ